MNKNEFYELTGLKDPFKIEKPLRPLNIIGWYGDHQFIRDLVSNYIDEVKRSINILEIGSFTGQSAINMAKILKVKQPESLLFCVDTWLGSEEHWKKDSKAYHLDLFDYFENGISGLYDRFISNVIHMGVQDQIIPIPNTSTTAIKLLKHWKIGIDIVYVDGDHSQPAVYNDIKDSKEIRVEGGITFGDDYHWDSVRAAVLTYNEFRKPAEVYNNRFWVLR